MEKRLRLTEKDRELLGLFDKWNYLTVDEVMLMLDRKKTAVVWRLGRLVEMGLVKRKSEIIGEYVYYTGGIIGLGCRIIVMRKSVSG